MDGQTIGGALSLDHPQFLGSGRSAQAEILQIVEAGRNGFKRTAVATVLLDEDVLGTGLARVSKDLHPINATLAGRSERVGPAVIGEAGGARREARLEVLDMEQRKAPRMLSEVVERVLTGVGGPENVHLHFEEFGVRERQHNVVSGGVIQARKLVFVGVVAEL